MEVQERIVTKEEIEQYLKEKGIDVNTWLESNPNDNNPYINKQVVLLQKLKEVLQQQVKSDKALLNELVISKSKKTKK